MLDVKIWGGYAHPGHYKYCGCTAALTLAFCSPYWKDDFDIPPAHRAHIPFECRRARYHRWLGLYRQNHPPLPSQARGEIVTTISSIGVNVETVDITTSSKKKLSLSLWDVGSGCGGSSFRVQMLRWYTPGASALIWMVDSTDVRQHESIEEGLRLVLADIDTQMADFHFPVLVLANKSDMPNAVPLDDIRIMFSDVLKGRIAGVFSTSITKEGPKGLPEAFDWLGLALDIAKTAKKSGGVIPTISPATASTPNPRDPSLLAKRLGEWLQRTESDSSPEEFVSQFNSYDLPAWDHYTHIRLAFLLLIYHGRQNGKDLIFSGIQSYIANNTTGQTASRGFHFTMTYFWIQIVHFGIRNLPEYTAPQVGAGRYPSSDDFFRFLLVNPHVTDGGLWMDYYTKEVIMSPAAKEGMVLPERKPLPSLSVRDTIQGFGAR